MANRENCVYCGKPITKRSREHIIQNAIGGLYESEESVVQIVIMLWSSIFVTLVAKKYHESVTLPSGLRMVYDNH